MKLLATLKDSDVGCKPRPVQKYFIRNAARAVLWHKNKIALLHVPKTYDGKFIVKRDFVFLAKANE